MKLLFLGTKGEIEEESLSHKNHASLLIESEGFKVLVDFGETYSRKDFEKIAPDAVIVTHAHDDHIAGLKGFPIEVPVYLHEGIRESRYFKREDYQFLKERSYSPHRSFSVGPFRIRAVPVLHSLYAPNVALFIEAEGFKLCYASDVLSISKEDRDKYLVGCDLYIGDGSTLTRDLVRRKDDDPYGHKSIRGQLSWLRDASVESAIFTHFGKEAVMLGDEELEKRFSNWRKELGLSSLKVAKDRESIELGLIQKQVRDYSFFRVFRWWRTPSPETLIALMPEHKIYVEPFAGAANLLFAKEPSELEILCDSDPTIIRLLKVCKGLSEQDFANLSRRNWVGSEKRFKALKEKLELQENLNDLDFLYMSIYTRHFSYLYGGSFKHPWEGFDKFDPLPRLRFCCERLEKVRIYKLDFRDTFRRFDTSETFFFCDPPYPTRSSGSGFSVEDYTELAELIKKSSGKVMLVIYGNPEIVSLFREAGLEERKFRRLTGPRPKSKIRYLSLFTNFKLKNLEKAAFLPVRPSGEKRGPRKTWQEVASHFNKPFKIVDGFVKLTGGVVNWPEGTEGDFDVLICTIPEKELFKRTEFRLGRGAPPEIAERLDIRQKEEVGVSPFTNYVVLGDLVFIPREKLEVVEMTAELLEADAEKEAELSLREDKIKPLRHFHPLKPLRGAKPATKQTIDSLLALLTEDLFPFFVSPKKDGARNLLHRDGKEVRIISDDGIDNTDKLPRLKERLLEVPHKSFVLDTEIELWKDGQHFPREAAAGAIHSGREEGLIVNVFDILYLDGEDLHKLPQEERLRILREFPVDQEAEEIPKPEKLLNRVQHKLAKDKESLRELIKHFSYLPGSEGVVIKRAVSPYPLTGEPGRTKCWWKFHKSIDAVVTVIRRNETKTKGVYVYDYGIEAKKRKGLLPHPTEQVKGKTLHLIGRTFMTNEFMNPGDRFWVEAETVNLIENLDDGTWRFTFWVPTFLEKTDRAEHSPEEIIRGAKSENIFQWKVIKDGKTIYHPKEPVKKIKDIHAYDPRKISDQVLQDDWRIVAAWFSSLKEGKKLKYREEEVVWLASRILKEIFRRGKVTFGYVR